MHGPPPVTGTPVGVAGGRYALGGSMAAPPSSPRTPAASGSPVTTPRQQLQAGSSIFPATGSSHFMRRASTPPGISASAPGLHAIAHPTSSVQLGAWSSAMMRIQSTDGASAVMTRPAGQAAMAQELPNPAAMQPRQSFVVGTPGNTSPRDTLRAVPVPGTPPGISTPRAMPVGATAPAASMSPVASVAQLRRVSQGSTVGSTAGTSTPGVSVTQLQAQRNDLPRFGAEDAGKASGKGFKAQEVASKLNQEPQVQQLQDRVRPPSEVPSQFGSPRHSPRHSRRPSQDRNLRPSPSEKGIGLVGANAEFRNAMQGLKKKPISSKPGPEKVTESMKRLNNTGASSSSSREACCVQPWHGPLGVGTPRERDGNFKYPSLSTSSGPGASTPSLLVKTTDAAGETDEGSTQGTTYGGSEASQSYTDIRQISMVSMGSTLSSTGVPESPGIGRLVSQASTDAFGSFGSTGTSLSQLFREKGIRSQSSNCPTPAASRSRLNSPREKKSKRTWSPRPCRKGVEYVEQMPSLKAAALAAVQSGNPGLRTGILSGQISPRKLSPPGSPRLRSPRNSPPRQSRPEALAALAEAARDSLYTEKNRRKGQDGHSSPRGSSSRGIRERVSREPASSSHMGGSPSEQSLAAVAAKATGKVAREAGNEGAYTPRQIAPTREAAAPRDAREGQDATAESDARPAASDAAFEASNFAHAAADSGHAAPPSPRPPDLPRPYPETVSSPIADEVKTQATTIEAAAATTAVAEAPAGPAPVKVWVRPPEVHSPQPSQLVQPTQPAPQIVQVVQAAPQVVQAPRAHPPGVVLI